LDAFERASNAVSLSIAGAGLGLAIVDFIVFEHGGEWTISSVENEGTVVELRFPRLRSIQRKIDSSAPEKVEI
jgi:signal transduction histidine kinase